MEKPLANEYTDFITNRHPLFERYRRTWKKARDSWYGSEEYRQGRYLKAYASDLNTASDSVATYEMADDGTVVAKYKAKVTYGTSEESTRRGDEELTGSFYHEKLESTPFLNYVKLIVSEYNSILFRNPPQRQVGDSTEAKTFIKDVDGSGENINEFMSMVDMMTSVYGVCHIMCYKPIGGDLPKWKIYSPLDVTNWEYAYDIDGNLILKKIVVKVEESDEHIIFRMITPETVETVFVSNDKDYIPPVDDPRLEQVDEGVFRIVQENELGKIFVKTAYQNVKIYNNVGSTIIHDVADINQAITNYGAEIYASVAYSAHPSLVVDETTLDKNGGVVGSEPGSLVSVQSSLTGVPSYTYEFVSPQLESIEKIQNIIDNYVDKLSQISMLRTEDLIKSAKSGEQIQVYDDKLAAQIRRKAINMENLEEKLWDLWYEWTGIQKPADFSISYNRQYNKKALEQEISEINQMMSTYQNYKTMFTNNDSSVEAPEYSTQAEAEAEAQRLGGSGFHSHEEEDGTMVYMPFPTHAEYEQAIGIPGETDDGDLEQNIRAKIRERMEQLMNSTSTSNGL